MGFLLSPFYPSHTYVSSPLQLILSKAASGPARLLSQPTLFTSPSPVMGSTHLSQVGGGFREAGRGLLLFPSGIQNRQSHFCYQWWILQGALQHRQLLFLASPGAPCNPSMSRAISAARKHHSPFGSPPSLTCILRTGYPCPFCQLSRESRSRYRHTSKRWS